MAIYHASTKSLSRSSGRSAVAAAAYRAADKLIDERSGQQHDYSKKGGVVHSEIITPSYGMTLTRSALWNAAELAEKRKDARTAREWIIALPSELNAEQRTALARTFAVELSSRYNVAVDLAIHTPNKAGDQRNHHAHLLCTTRQLLWRDGQAVLDDKASIELSDTKRRSLGLGRVSDEITAVRTLWEDLANGALRKAGQQERIDSRSFKAQGIEQEPTQHLGPVASAMERRGRKSDRGDGNRQVAENNARRPAREWTLKHELTLLYHQQAGLEWASKLRDMPEQERIEAWDKEVGRRAQIIAQRARALETKLHKAIRTVEDRRETLQSQLRMGYRVFRQIGWDVLGIRAAMQQKKMDEYENKRIKINELFETRLETLSRRHDVARKYRTWGTAYAIDHTKRKAEKSLERALPLLAASIKQTKEERKRQRDEQWKLERSRSRGKGWSR